MLSTNKTLTTEELMEKSKQILDSSSFDYISGGAGTEWGMSNNLHAFQRYQIIPRVLQRCGNVDTSTALFGKQLSWPIIIAPSAFHKLVCKQGELATAKAAEKSDVIFTLSTMSSYSIEDVASASSSDKWFQLYIFKNKEITQDLVKRAEEAGYSALVVTVDVPAMGMRLRDIKNKFSLPTDIEAVNFNKFALASISDKTDGSKIKSHTDQQFDSNLSWDSINWLKSITKLPIILKGILSPEDASEALKHKIDGIIVSNHGGRQIDSIISPLDALPEIARIVGNQLPLILDGGIRNGEDIFKAIALGAHAVMFARPILWALSVGGEDEVIALFARLKEEFSLTMQLAGCNNLKIIRERGLSLLSGANINAFKFLELLRKIENNPDTENAVKTTSTLRFFMNET